MSRYLHRYGIDPTGKNPSNLVQHEVRTLVRRARRALVPKYGAFYSDSLRVRDKATNQLLVAGKHYVPSRLYAEPTAEFGKEVYGIVIITDPMVSDDVVLDYQVVGGQYEDSLPVILELMNTVRNDTRTLSFNAISNRPTTVNPVRHLHDLGDSYGHEYLTHAIERTRMMMELSSNVDYDQYLRYVDHLALTLANLASLLATEIFGSHALDAAAHWPYVLRTKLESSIVIIRKPGGVTPANNATAVSRSPAFILGPYYNMYRAPQKSLHVQVARTNDFSTALVVDAALANTNSSYAYQGSLPANTGLYWRGRYQADDLSWSDWSTPLFFTTGST
jgi:hypothetical protein